MLATSGGMLAMFTVEEKDHNNEFAQTATMTYRQPSSCRFRMQCCSYDWSLQIISRALQVLTKYTPIAAVCTSLFPIATVEALY